MNKKNNTNTILFFLLLILFVIFLLYTFASFKEGAVNEATTLNEYYADKQYFIYFANTYQCLTDTGTSFQNIQLINRDQYVTNANSKWRFYKNSDNTYKIQNLQTKRYLSFRTHSNGKTYLVAYSDISKVESNSYNWKLRFSYNDYWKTSIPIMLISNNSIIKNQDENTLLKIPLANNNLDLYMRISTGW